MQSINVALIQSFDKNNRKQHINWKNLLIELYQKNKVVGPKFMTLRAGGTPNCPIHASIIIADSSIVDADSIIKVVINMCPPGIGNTAIQAEQAASCFHYMLAVNLQAMGVELDTIKPNVWQNKVLCTLGFYSSDAYDEISERQSLVVKQCAAVERSKDTALPITYISAYELSTLVQADIRLKVNNIMSNEEDGLLAFTFDLGMKADRSLNMLTWKYSEGTNDHESNLKKGSCRLLATCETSDNSNYYPSGEDGGMAASVFNSRDNALLDVPSRMPFANNTWSSKIIDDDGGGSSVSQGRTLTQESATRKLNQLAPTKDEAKFLNIVENIRQGSGISPNRFAQLMLLLVTINGAESLATTPYCSWGDISALPSCNAYNSQDISNFTTTKLQLDTGVWVVQDMVQYTTYYVANDTGLFEQYVCYKPNGIEECSEMCADTNCLNGGDYIASLTNTSDCNCTSSFYSPLIKVLLSGVVYNTMSIKSFTLGIARPQQKLPTQYGLEQIGQQTRNTESCILYSTVLKGEIIVNGWSVSEAADIVIIIKIIKGPYSQTTHATGGTLTFVMPEKWLLKSDTVVTERYDDGVLCGVVENQVVGYQVCRLSDCVLCTDAFENFNCLPVTDRMLLVTGTIILIMLTFTILGVWGWAIYAFIKLCFALFVAPYYLLKNVNESRLVTWFKAKMGNGIKGVVNAGTAKPKMPAYAFLLFGILVMTNNTTEASTCVEGISIPSQITTCLDIGGSVEECNVLFSALVSIPYIGGVACLTLVDDVTLEVLAEVELEYSDLSQIYSLERIYYTADYNIVGKSKDICPNKNKCSNKFIVDWLEADDSFYHDMWTVADEPDLEWPGHVSAFKNDGGILHGCAGASGDKCIFGTYGIKPIFSTLRSVYKLLPPSLNPTIDWKVVSEGTEEGHITFSGLPVLSGNMQMRFDGLLDTPVNDISSHGAKKMIEYKVGNTVYRALEPASDANIPIKGRIGDIQSGSQTNLQVAKRNGFIFNQQIVKEVLTGYSVAFVSDESGVADQVMNDFLPLVDSYGLTTYQSGKIVRRLDESGAALVSVSSTDGFKVTRTHNLVCPLFTSAVDATGCFSCEDGVVLTFTARSTCSDGFSTVSIHGDISHVSLETNSVLLLQDSTDVSIGLHTSESKNNIILCLHQTAAIKFCQDVSFTVKDVDIIDADSNNTVNKDHEKGSMSWSPGGVGGFFRNAFESLFTWKGSLVNKVIGAILTIVILYTLVKFFPVALANSKVAASEATSKAKALIGKAS